MPPPAKAVLISLADMANDEGYCWPSIERLCERTCFGRTAVIDAIYWLETHAVLKAHRTNGRKTTYTVTPESFSEEESVVVVKRASRAAVRPPMEAVDKYENQSATRTGPPDEPVRQTDSTSPPDGLDQSAARTLTVITAKEPSIPPVGPPGGASTFDDLLAIWPAKRRAAWMRAKRSLDRMIKRGLADMDEVVRAARASLQDPEWQKDGGKFVPRLDRWVRQRGWDTGVADDWQNSRAGVDAMARRLGMQPWDELAFREGRPGALHILEFKARVIKRYQESLPASHQEAA